MLPNPNFIYCPPIQTYFVDKDTGFPLSAGVVTFYEDNNRTVKKAIYEQTENPLGTFFYTQLNNPVILTSVGTFADNNGNDINVFLYPYVGSPNDAVRGAVDLYYVTVESSGGVAQETRSAWPPNVQIAGTGTINDLPETVNELQNPQFVEVLFPTNSSTGISTATTFNVTGTNTYTSIAPAWQMLTSGTGSVVVSQVAIGASTPTNPPYALQIQSGSGVTAISLVQRVFASPTLLSATIINGMVLAASLGGGGSANVTLTYHPSSGTDTQIFALQTTNDQSLSLLQASVTLSNVNSGTAPSGYIDFVITLQTGIEYQISSCQLTTVSAVTSIVPFLELSTPLQQSGLFSYWQPALNDKEIPSYLTGWDFSLNPSQFYGDALSGPVTTTNGSKYIWDQTILFSTVDNVMTWARNTSSGGLTLTTGSTSTSFAIIQYLGQAQAREILTNDSCVSVNAAITTGAGPVTCNVSIWWTATTLPNANTGYSLVSAVDNTTAIPSVGGGSYGTWTQVTNAYNNGSVSITTTTPSGTRFDIPGFIASSTGASTATAIAIVVSFSQITSAQAVTVNFAGLFRGSIPTRPAPQTPDEVLRECQYYYEKSYDRTIVPGTAASTPGSLQAFHMPYGSTGAWGLPPQTFNFRFAVFKRITAPLVTLYSPSAGTSGNVDVSLVVDGSLSAGSPALAVVLTYWDATVSDGQTGTVYLPISATSMLSGPQAGQAGTIARGFIYFQYTCDARLGIV